MLDCICHGQAKTQHVKAQHACTCLTITLRAVAIEDSHLLVLLVRSQLDGFAVLLDRLLELSTENKEAGKRKCALGTKVEEEVPIGSCVLRRAAEGSKQACFPAKRLLPNSLAFWALTRRSSAGTSISKGFSAGDFGGGTALGAPGVCAAAAFCSCRRRQRVMATTRPALAATITAAARCAMSSGLTGPN